MNLAVCHRFARGGGGGGADTNSLFHPKHLVVGIIARLRRLRSNCFPIQGRLLQPEDPTVTTGCRKLVHGKNQNFWRHFFFLSFFFCRETEKKTGGFIPGSALMSSQITEANDCCKCVGYLIFYRFPTTLENLVPGRPRGSFHDEGYDPYPCLVSQTTVPTTISL